MKKLLIITIILFVSWEAPVANEANSETFEKNVQTIKNTWVAGYMEGNADKVISMMADSIKWNGPDGSTVGIDVLKESVQFWIENFEDVSFEEGSGLPGTDVGYWGGNTYPLSQAMSGPNNIRMYGTWSMKNSNTGKTAKVKSYAVLTFNEDGKVIEATEFGSYNSVLQTFE